jgi:hypothetical protein
MILFALIVSAPSDAAAQTSECIARLRALGHGVEAAEQPVSSNPGCRIEEPVRLSAVRLSSNEGASIRFSNQPLLACRFADSLARWLNELVAPLIKGDLGVEIIEAQTGSGFECRARNHELTARLSAHGEGLALDIVSFRLTDGSLLRVEKDPSPAHRRALQSLRTAACGWFTTVLGPGSDAAHASHLHVDSQPHGKTGSYRICQ